MTVDRRGLGLCLGMLEMVWIFWHIVFVVHQKLRNAIHLVIVFGIRETGQFPMKVRQPGRGFVDVNDAVFQYGCIRHHPSHLVMLRLDGLHPVQELRVFSEILGQWVTRGGGFDEN